MYSLVTPEVEANVPVELPMIAPDGATALYSEPEAPPATDCGEDQESYAEMTPAPNGSTGIEPIERSEEG